MTLTNKSQYTQGEGKESQHLHPSVTHTHHH
jgi:hypothetical protein